MLRARLATAAIAIPLLLALIFAAPHWSFAAFVCVVALQGVVEFADMAFRDRPGQRRIALALGVMVAVATAFGTPDQVFGAIAALLVLGLIWTLLGRPDFEQGLTDLGSTMIGTLYAGFLLGHFIWLHRVPHGAEWITFIILTAMMGDTAGYFVGHAYGRHKLIPRVSPGKTVEGALGIMGASLLAGLIATWWPFQYIGCGVPFLSLHEAVLLALVMGVLGQLGDLGESIMKRTYGVKESGWLLPGHGGVLDRIDSLLFPAVVVYYYATLFR